jgi:hypothetical protein
MHDPHILAARRIEAALRAACPLGADCMCCDANAEGDRPPECPIAAPAPARAQAGRSRVGPLYARAMAAASVAAILGMLYGRLLF